MGHHLVSPYISIISIILPLLSAAKNTRLKQNAAPRQVLPVLRCGAGQLALEVGQIVEEALDAWEGQWLIIRRVMAGVVFLSCRNFHGCFLLEENLVVLKPVLDTLDATFTGNPYPLVN